MGERRRYRKKSDQFIVAVQLNLVTEGFGYQKWGGEQRCKPGDWLVDNNGDFYTVDRDTFDQTYEKKGPGIYVKSTRIWAEKVSEPGKVNTREGSSKYEAGDYLVSRYEDGLDAYPVKSEAFESMFEPDD